MVTACWTLEIGDKEHIKRVKKKRGLTRSKFNLVDIYWMCQVHAIVNGRVFVMYI